MFKEHFFVFDEQSMQIQEVTKNNKKKRRITKSTKKINSISKTEKKKKTEKIPNVATVH